MIRNFVAGALWGVAVAGVGLGVISQVAPMPGAQEGVGAGNVVVASEGEAVPAKPAAPDADPAKPVVPKADADTVPTSPAPKVDVAPELPAITRAKPSLPELAAPKAVLPADAPLAAPAETIAPAVPADGGRDDQLALGDAADAPAAKTAPPRVADAPAALDAPAAAKVDLPAVATVDPTVDGAKPDDLPQAPQTDAVPNVADAPPPPPEALLDPAPQINANPAPATIKPDQPTAEPAPLPEVPADVPITDSPPEAPAQAEADPAPQADTAIMQPVAPPEPAPGLIAKDQPSTFAPDASITESAGGVTTGRLPRIGDQAAAAGSASVPVEQPPLEKFAQDFANPTGKPLFAIILRDTGGADVDRATLAALPFPVSFVVDPLAPNAAEAAAIYHAAGQEVIMLASGIPSGAQASDLEQTFQSLGAALPQAVAVMDLAKDGFQDNRPLASLVVPIVKSQGRGLITFNRGLNAADQVARREDVPAATIFRQLDAEGEDLPLVRRYLDRAAFKAAQEGRVVVLGDTTPSTIAALMEWTVEGRASSVTLAPVTAVLSVD